MSIADIVGSTCCGIAVHAATPEVQLESVHLRVVHGDPLIQFAN